MNARSPRLTRPTIPPIVHSTADEDGDKDEDEDEDEVGRAKSQSMTT